MSKKLRSKSPSYKYEEILVSTCLTFDEIAGAAHKVDKIIRNDCEKAWDLVIAFLKFLPSDEFIEEFAVDELELFVSLHGERFIERIENEAKINPVFRKSLEYLCSQKRYLYPIPANIDEKLHSLYSQSDDSIVEEFRTEKIITSWVVYQTTKWADRKLGNLVNTEPELAWPLILDLIEKAESVQALADIAAGPLENLLVKHGEKFIERIEMIASKNKRFRLCLSGVWGWSAISDDIGKRFDDALGNENIDEWKGALPGND